MKSYAKSLVTVMSIYAMAFACAKTQRHAPEASPTPAAGGFKAVGVRTLQILDPAKINQIVVVSGEVNNYAINGSLVEKNAGLATLRNGTSINCVVQILNINLIAGQEIPNVDIQAETLPEKDNLFTSIITGADRTAAGTPTPTPSPIVSPTPNPTPASSAKTMILTCMKVGVAPTIDEINKALNGIALLK